MCLSVSHSIRTSTEKGNIARMYSNPKRFLKKFDFCRRKNVDGCHTHTLRVCSPIESQKHKHKTWQIYEYFFRGETHSYREKERSNDILHALNQMTTALSQCSQFMWVWLNQNNNKKIRKISQANEQRNITRNRCNF